MIANILSKEEIKKAYSKYIKDPRQLIIESTISDVIVSDRLVDLSQEYSEKLDKTWCRILDVMNDSGLFELRSVFEKDLLDEFFVDKLKDEHKELSEYMNIKISGNKQLKNKGKSITSLNNLMKDKELMNDKSFDVLFILILEIVYIEFKPHLKFLYKTDSNIKLFKKFAPLNYSIVEYCKVEDNMNKILKSELRKEMKLKMSELNVKKTK